MIATSRSGRSKSAAALELGSVLREVLRARDEAEVLGSVVERVAVFVVHNEAVRNGAVCSLPHANCAQPPAVGLGDLHPCPEGAALVRALSDRPERRLVRGGVADGELCCGGQAQALDAAVPWGVPFGECVSRPATRAVPVAHSPCVRHGGEARFGVPCPAALLRAEPSGVCAVRLHREGGPADLTSLVDHAGIVAHSRTRASGSGTTGVAALMEGRRVILCERVPEYAEIARRRCEAAETDADWRAPPEQAALFGGAR